MSDVTINSTPPLDDSKKKELSDALDAVQKSLTDAHITSFTAKINRSPGLMVTTIPEDKSAGNDYEIEAPTQLAPEHTALLIGAMKQFHGAMDQCAIDNMDGKLSRAPKGTGTTSFTVRTTELA